MCSGMKENCNEISSAEKTPFTLQVRRQCCPRGGLDAVRHLLHREVHGAAHRRGQPGRVQQEPSHSRDTESQVRIADEKNLYGIQTLLNVKTKQTLNTRG